MDVNAVPHPGLENGLLFPMFRCSGQKASPSARVLVFPSPVLDLN